MVDARISCARLRDPACSGRAPLGRAGESGTSEPRASPACLGRARLGRAVESGTSEPRAPRRRPGTDALSIAAGPSPRPGQAGARPEVDDLVASTI